MENKKYDKFLLKSKHSNLSHGTPNPDDQKRFDLSAL